MIVSYQLQYLSCALDSLRVLLVLYGIGSCVYVFFFFQAEDGIRDLVRSRGLGDVYKRQSQRRPARRAPTTGRRRR